MLEDKCPCTKADCERYGDCVACYKHHEPKPNPTFCKRPGTAVPAGLEERVNARLLAAGITKSAEQGIVTHSSCQNLRRTAK